MDIGGAKDIENVCVYRVWVLACMHLEAGGRLQGHSQFETGFPTEPKA